MAFDPIAGSVGRRHDSQMIAPAKDEGALHRTLRATGRPA
jgi:hypothetical protein